MFKIVSKCEAKYLYLYKSAKDEVEEVCIDDLTDPVEIAKLEKIP